MITNIDLVNYCKKALGHPYWYGCYGLISSESLYKYKKKQYPSQYTWELPKAQLNTRVFDCIGLVKGAIWSNANFNKNPLYTPSQDVSANGMLAKCTVKGNIKNIPEVIGLLVFCNGHVGVYIGNGEVIEAKGHKYGVVKSKLKNRPFTAWAYCPWIDYITEKKKSNTKYYPKCKDSYISIVDALASLNIDSSFTHRKAIAKANGIKKYSGKAQQNIDMLNMLKAGKLKKG